MSTSFEPSDRTRLRRKPGRGSYDEARIFSILDAGVVCHVGYVLDGQPYVTPTAYWRDGRRLYWHGAAASRMTQAQARGMAVCVTVSHVDGFVLARTGLRMSLQYRSVMAFGRTAPIDDPALKRRLMNAFIDRLFPGRSRELRPMHEAELAAISVIAMTIEEASAKGRDDGPQDLAEDLSVPCWAGVIPIRSTLGRAIPDPRLAIDPALPPSLAPYAEHARLDDLLTAAAREAR